MTDRSGLPKATPDPRVSQHLGPTYSPDGSYLGNGPVQGAVRASTARGVPEAPAVTDEPDAADAAPDEALAAFSMPDLRGKAKALGLVGYKTLRKDELVRLVGTAQRLTEEGVDVSGERLETITDLED